VLHVQKSNTEKYTTAISKIIHESIQDVYKEIERKKIIADKNIAAIDKLHMKDLGEVRKQFEDMLLKVYEQAMRDGRQTLIAKRKVIKFQDIDFRRMTPSEVLDFWKKKSYFMTQMERDNIWKLIKPVIFDTIKTGGTIKEFIQEADKRMEQYFYKGEIEDAEKYTGARLETIIRTNTSEAYNYGLRQYFEDPALDGFVEAYQYSAILDDRVRPNHAALDGLVFSVTNPAIDRIIPPNGYNCRCLLVPVVQGEKWEESTLPANWKPDAGFDKPGA
jgi:SPP1 gp7 family putative phage head morphogenesis protein